MAEAFEAITEEELRPPLEAEVRAEAAVAEVVAAVGVVEAASRTSLGEETKPIREPSIQISPKVNGGGVACITAGGSLHFSALSRPPAPGRTL